MIWKVASKAANESTYSKFHPVEMRENTKDDPIVFFYDLPLS